MLEQVIMIDIEQSGSDVLNLFLKLCANVSDCGSAMKLKFGFKTDSTGA